MKPAAAWHEVECGGYAADLAVWERLADSAGGAVLELGCGSGRVALHLARREHEVWAVDADPALLEVLESRASTEGLAVRAHLGDVRALELDREFGLAIAPMQVMQMLGGEGSRHAALERAAGHLAPGGRLAAAIVERPADSVEGVGAWRQGLPRPPRPGAGPHASVPGPRPPVTRGSPAGPARGPLMVL